MWNGDNDLVAMQYTQKVLWLLDLRLSCLRRRSIVGGLYVFTG